MPPPPAPIARSSSKSSKRSEPEMIAVGQVVAAHALRGVVRVRAYNPPAPSLAAGRSVLLEAPGGARHEVPVLSATPFRGGLVLVAFQDTDSREAAEALVGSRVLVPGATCLRPAPTSSTTTRSWDSRSRRSGASRSARSRRPFRRG